MEPIYKPKELWQDKLKPINRNEVGKSIANQSRHLSLTLNHISFTDNNEYRYPHKKKKRKQNNRKEIKRRKENTIEN